MRKHCRTELIMFKGTGDDLPWGGVFLGGKNKKTLAFAEGGRDEARVCPPTLEERKNVNTTYIIDATFERARKKAAGC
jgi:hypothetical protein